MTMRLKTIVLGFLLGAACRPCRAGETATLRNGFTLHYERRESVGETTRLYLTQSTDNFVDVHSDDIIEIEADKAPATAPPAPPPSVLPSVVHHPVQLDEALSAASRKNNVSPDLLRSVIRVESGFNPNARSAKGALGLMQLMPATAARMGVRDVFDPQQNLDGGARYLKELLNRYHNNLNFALAAYNAGPERVEAYHGVPPFQETITYVNRIVRDFNRQSVSGRTTAPNNGIHRSSFQPALRNTSDRRPSDSDRGADEHDQVSE